MLSPDSTVAVPVTAMNADGIHAAFFSDDRNQYI